MRHILTCLFLSSAMITPIAAAQQSDVTSQPAGAATQANESQTVLFGDENQPGRAIQTEIVNLVNSGTPVVEAISQTIGKVASEDDTTVSGTARLVIGLNKGISVNFMSNMMSSNKLSDATKGSIETFPSDAASVVQLAVTLYPSFAQDVIDAAVTTGEIEPNDALLAAIAAGADPTTVSSATAAGDVAVAGTPTGTGIGAAGAGGGDTTASTN